MTKKKIIKKNGQNIIVKKKTVKKLIPNAEPKNENIVLDTLMQKMKESLMKDLVPAVVNVLKPDLDKAVNGRFEDIKNIINNEMKDVRQGLAINSEIPQQTQHIPQVEGDNPSLSPQPEAQNLMGQEAIMSLLSGLLGSNTNQGGGGFNQIIMEGIQRKMLADMNRQDIQSQAISQAVVKRLLGDDPNLEKYQDSLTQTNDALMKPLHDYGKNMQKRDEEAKKE